MADPQSNSGAAGRKDDFGDDLDFKIEIGDNAEGSGQQVQSMGSGISK